MRRLIASLAGCLLAVMLLPGCEETPTEVRIGRVAVEWNEADDDLSEFDHDWSVQLLTTEEQWQDWVATLPSAMQEARSDHLAKVDLSESVLLVAVWGKCTEVASVENLGDGAVRFDIHNPEPMTVCEWSPTQVQVWDLPLSQLGVERDEVRLVE